MIKDLPDTPLELTFADDEDSELDNDVKTYKLPQNSEKTANQNTEIIEVDTDLNSELDLTLGEEITSTLIDSHLGELTFADDPEDIDINIEPEKTEELSLIQETTTDTKTENNDPAAEQALLPEADTAETSSLAETSGNEPPQPTNHVIQATEITSPETSTSASSATPTIELHTQTAVLRKKKFNWLLVIMGLLSAIVMVAINFIIFSGSSNVKSLDGISSALELAQPLESNLSKDSKTKKETLTVQMSPFESFPLSGNYEFIYSPAKNKAQFTLTASTPKPRARTIEEIGKKMASEVWLKKIETQKTQIDIPDEGSFSIVTVPTRFYHEQNNKTKRTINDVTLKISRGSDKITISYNMEKQSLTGEVTFSFSP